MVKTEDETGSGESAASGTPDDIINPDRFINYGALKGNGVPGSPVDKPANPYTRPEPPRGE